MLQRDLAWFGIRNMTLAPALVRRFLNAQHKGETIDTLPLQVFDAHDGEASRER